MPENRMFSEESVVVLSNVLSVAALAYDKRLSSDIERELCVFNVPLSEICKTSSKVFDLENQWKLMGFGHHS
jgi:hypothetical protein